jgi:hypothetical protein
MRLNAQTYGAPTALAGKVAQGTPPLSPPPITYEVNGVQYIAITTHPDGDAFAVRRNDVAGHVACRPLAFSDTIAAITDRFNDFPPGSSDTTARKRPTRRRRGGSGADQLLEVRRRVSRERFELRYDGTPIVGAKTSEMPLSTLLRPTVRACHATIAAMQSSHVALPLTGLANTAPRRPVGYRRTRSALSPVKHIGPLCQHPVRCRAPERLLLEWTPPFEQRSLRRESLTSCSLQRFWLRALRVVQILVIAQPLLHGHHDRGAFIALLHAIDEPVDHRNR